MSNMTLACTIACGGATKTELFEPSAGAGSGGLDGVAGLAGFAGFGGALPLGGSAGGAGLPSTTGGATSGAGGSLSAAGTAGVAGAGPITRRHTFDTDLERWIVQYASADPATGAAAIPESAVILRQVFDAATQNGVLEARIPYSARGQHVGLGVSLAVPLNLTGKTLTAMLRLDAGLNPPEDLQRAPGRATLYAKSGPGYVYANGFPVELRMVGSLLTLSFPFATPSYVDDSDPSRRFDPADIREYGIEISSNSSSAVIVPAVISIDDVTF